MWKRNRLKNSSVNTHEKFVGGGITKSSAALRSVLSEESRMLYKNYGLQRGGNLSHKTRKWRDMSPSAGSSVEVRDCSTFVVSDARELEFSWGREEEVGYSAVKMVKGTVCLCAGGSPPEESPEPYKGPRIVDHSEFWLLLWNARKTSCTWTRL